MMTAGSDHITAQEFRLWLEGARPGGRIVYLDGFLAKSLGSDGKKAKDPNLAALVALAIATWDARKRVHLLQRRVAPGRFEYIAVRNGASG